jgi:hypothetical protein
VTTWIRSGGKPRITDSQVREPCARWVGAQAAVPAHIGEHAARLEGDRGDPLAGHPLADPVGRLRERLVRVAGGQPLAEGHVGRRAVVQQGRPARGRLQRAGDGGELGVVDDDELGGVRGQLGGVGDHEDHRLARPQDLVARQHRMPRVQRARRECVAPGKRPDACLGQVVGGEDRRHAGGLAGLLDVDAGDLGVRERRADREGVQRAGQRHVIDVPAAASEQRRVLPAGQRASDEAFANCHGHLH